MAMPVNKDKENPHARLSAGGRRARLIHYRNCIRFSSRVVQDNQEVTNCLMIEFARTLNLMYRFCGGIGFN